MFFYRIGLQLGASAAETCLSYNYFEQVGFDDIALLRLNRLIKFEPTLKPIYMSYEDNDPIDESLYPANLTMSVWGHTLKKHDIPVKRYKSVRIVLRQNCKIHVEETQLCSDFVQQGEVCQGDSEHIRRKIYGSRGYTIDWSQDLCRYYLFTSLHSNS